MFKWLKYFIFNNIDSVANNFGPFSLSEDVDCYIGRGTQTLF